MSQASPKNTIIHMMANVSYPSKHHQIITFKVENNNNCDCECRV